VRDNPLPSPWIKRGADVQNRPHQWVSEFVTQYWFSMYYNLWNIRKLTSHYFSDCSLDQGTFKKAKWQLGSKCSSSYSTLKASIASRIQTPTGARVTAGYVSREGRVLVPKTLPWVSSYPHAIIKMIGLEQKQMHKNEAAACGNVWAAGHWSRRDVSNPISSLLTNSLLIWNLITWFSSSRSFKVQKWTSSILHGNETNIEGD